VQYGITDRAESCIQCLTILISLWHARCMYVTTNSTVDIIQRESEQSPSTMFAFGYGIVINPHINLERQSHLKLCSSHWVLSVESNSVFTVFLFHIKDMDLCSKQYFNNTNIRSI
jgi:hypothetical protein